MKQKIQYLTLNSLQEGVGASQVLEYVLLLSNYFSIRLVTIEVLAPPADLILRLNNADIEWVYVKGDRRHTLSKLLNFYRFLRLVDSRLLTHARSDITFVLAAIKGVKRIIWDSRSLNAEQTIFIKSKKRLSFEYLTLRVIERYCAKNSEVTICITQAARTFLIQRFRMNPDRVHVISTCANLNRFNLSDLPKTQGTVRVLFSGTLSSAYDIELMNSILTELRSRFKVEFTMALSLGHTQLYRQMAPDRVLFLSHDEMPKEVSQSHFGLSILKSNIGVSLLSVSSTKNAEFLASGRPIIVNANQGDIGSLVENNAIGVATYGSSDTEVSDYVNEIERLLKYSSTSIACRQIAKEYFDLDAAVRCLIAIYNGILDQRD